ncbi:hypothetical protein HHI36_002116 [Cryptolaemus montrouzieri]|uniref:Uncharacterized protein n=1 Tax=Cryptolaemus montrouzieri TaxID=559131 RepID=A0ABD2P9Y1_9CUCU
MTTKKDKLKSSIKLRDPAIMKERLISPKVWPTGIVINHLLNLQRRLEEVNTGCIQSGFLLNDTFEYGQTYSVDEVMVERFDSEPAISRVKLKGYQQMFWEHLQHIILQKFQKYYQLILKYYGA